MESRIDGGLKMEDDDWVSLGSVASDVMEKAAKVWENPGLADEIWENDERAIPEDEDEDGDGEIVDSGEHWDLED
jgi:hypothetical protein